MLILLRPTIPIVKKNVRRAFFLCMCVVFRLQTGSNRGRTSSKNLDVGCWKPKWPGSASQSQQSTSTRPLSCDWNICRSSVCRPGRPLLLRRRNTAVVTGNGLQSPSVFMRERRMQTRRRSANKQDPVVILALPCLRFGRRPPPPSAGPRNQCKLARCGEAEGLSRGRPGKPTRVTGHPIDRPDPTKKKVHSSRTAVSSVRSK